MASLTDSGKCKRKLFDSLDIALSAAGALQSKLEQAAGKIAPPDLTENMDVAFSDALES